VPTLKRLLKDEDKDVREYAAEALSKIERRPGPPEDEAP
jgi:HEAT repeat protein